MSHTVGVRCVCLLLRKVLNPNKKGMILDLKATACFSAVGG
jgi:hypothetical protein